MKIIELPDSESEALKPILDILNIEHKDIRIFTFGYKYIMMWQEVRNEQTSAEITMGAGFAYPYFIESKAVIYKFESELIDDDEISTLIDVDMSELKKHFNMDNAYWALRKMQVREPVVRKEMTEDDYLVQMEMDPANDEL